MDKAEITGFLAALDRHLSAPSTLYIYGSAVVILLDAPDRTSLDIDVAGPYSQIDQAELQRIAEHVKLPVNPESTYAGPHLEWVGPLRLCLPPPRPQEDGMLLWRGSKLSVRTGRVEDLVASKLIRYDPTDRADVQFLHVQFRFTPESVKDAVARLPEPFRSDVLVKDNFANLLSDIEDWKGREP